MFLFYTPNIEQQQTLSKEESKHCTKVLRKGVGDKIHSTDGNGGFYTLQIVSMDRGECQLSIKEKLQQDPKDFRIHIAIAPTKNSDRIELFVEKATEFGIDEITFLATSRTERPRLKLDRIERIAISAMKQSKEYFLPKINPMVPFNDFVDNHEDKNKYVAHVNLEGDTLDVTKLAPKSSSYTVLIGPEGDFSEDEIKHAFNKNYEPISLGPKILRTETAGIAVCHSLNLINY